MIHLLENNIISKENYINKVYSTDHIKLGAPNYAIFAISLSSLPLNFLT